MKHKLFLLTTLTLQAMTGNVHNYQLMNEENACLTA